MPWCLKLLIGGLTAHRPFGTFYHIPLPNFYFTPRWNINDYIPVPICIESVVILLVKQRNSINIQAEVASVFTMIIDKT